MARMIPLLLAEDEEDISSMARQRVFRDLKIVIMVWDLFSNYGPISDVLVRFPGSVHDSRIWKISGVVIIY